MNGENRNQSQKRKKKLIFGDCEIRNRQEVSPHLPLHMDTASLIIFKFLLKDNHIL
jgi:hypothetical protein